MITSLTNGGDRSSRSRPSKNIDLTHFTAASISRHQRRPRRRPGHGRRRQYPDQPELDPGHLPRQGDRRQGGGADHVLDPGDADQRPLRGHAAEHRPRRGPRHRGQRPGQPGDAGLRRRVPSLAKNLFVGGASYVTDTTADAGLAREPVPDHRRGHDGRHGGRCRGRPARRLHRERDAQAVRAAYSAAASSTDSTVFTTSTGDALSTIIRAPAVAPAART